MNQITTEELSAFLVGDLDPAAVERIEQSASSDAELAAKIAVMRMLLGSDEPAIDETVSRVHSPHAPPVEAVGKIGVARRGTGGRFRRFAIAAAVLLLVAAGVSGSWVWIESQRPAIEDDFNDRAFDPRKWWNRRQELREENGYLLLRNRGYLVTIKEFSGPLSIELDWRPMDLASDAFYLDCLTVALRTSGSPREKHSYEVSDGLMVKFNAQASNVSVSVPLPGDVEPAVLGLSPVMSEPMPSGDWQHLRIVDDGSTISVWAAPSAAAMPTEPLLRVPYFASSFTGTRIAIYNRELVSGVTHESHIDNVVVRTGIW